MNIIAQVFVDVAYFLRASQRYQRVKNFFYNLLENEHNPQKRYFDYLMMILIFTSVFILIREVKSHVNDFLLFFNNYIISLIFLLEYLLRLWVYNSNSDIIIKRYEKDQILSRRFCILQSISTILQVKFDFIRSPRAIIDLLAIMPFFHELRLFRLFILFRVFKLFRYTQSFQSFISVLATKKFEFFILLMFSSIVVFVSAVLIYVMEANNAESPIDTMFEAVYWAIVTISTVGYGDVTPVTDVGRMVAMGVIVAGLMVIAFSTSLVVSAFTEKLDEIKESKTIEDMNKYRKTYLICGYEDLAAQVALLLRSAGRNVIVIDADKEHVKRAKEDGFEALNFDPATTTTYHKMHINFEKNITAVLCLLEDDVQNVYTALTIRSLDPTVRMLSLLMRNQNRKKLQRAGINDIVYTQELVGLIAKEFGGQPVAFEAIHELRSQAKGVVLDEIIVDERVAKHIPNVGALNALKYRVIFMGIYKKEDNEFYFNPSKEMTLAEGDILVSIGETSFLQEYRIFLHQKVA